MDMTNRLPPFKKLLDSNFKAEKFVHSPQDSSFGHAYGYMLKPVKTVIKKVELSKAIMNRLHMELISVAEFK